MGICLALMRDCLVAAAACAAVAGEAAAFEKPNVVIILADDLGYGDVHCYNPDNGKIPTPHIDRLAADGMRFTDGHSSAAGCTPSRYSLLTGRYDVRNRMEGVGVFGGFGGPPLIPPQRMTIASLAKQGGYRTSCVGKWHVGWNWPITAAQQQLLGAQRRDALQADYRTPEVAPEQLRAWQAIFSQPFGGGPNALGFDLFYGIDVPAWPPFCFIDNDRSVGIPTQLVPEADLREDLSIAACQGPMVADWDFVRVLPELQRKACAEIAAASVSEMPFLLYIPLPSPHAPLAVSQDWLGKSGLGTYADWVMQTDAAVGSILDAIEESGESRNTLVIFSSDNGFSGTGLAELTSRGHHPCGRLRGFKAQPYEGGHRVPFIARWPAVVKPGVVCGQLVQQTDIFATLADILGIQVPDNAGEDSYSLLPLLRGEDRPVRSTAINSSGQGAYSLRQGSWKLIVDTAGKMKTRVQLFNLADDLSEKNDLAKDEVKRAGEMESLFRSIVAAGRSTPGPDQPNDGKLTRFAAAVGDSAAKPNVIFILMDDLGWRDTGFSGSAFYESPNIDRLAGKGVVFTHAYAAAPICSPTRASCLTGLHPARLGITQPVCSSPVDVLDAVVQTRVPTPEEMKSRSGTDPFILKGPQNPKALQVVSATRLKPEYTTIAELLRAHGYRTGHFGKWHLGPPPYSALEQGFDVDVPHANTPGPLRPGHFGPWPDWPGADGEAFKGRHIDDVLADRAIEFINESAQGGRPFYIDFWPFGVHIPFQARQEVIDHFRAKADAGNGQRNPLYAAMIKHTDDAIGRLWKAVEDAGLANNTAVVFLSDNGGVTNKMSGGGRKYGLEGVPVTDNAPLRGQKGDIYEGGVRVPGFLVWPGVALQGGKCGLPFCSVDAFATIADICGVTDIPSNDGRSFAAVCRGETTDRGEPIEAKPIFVHRPHYGHFGIPPCTSVIMDCWKLIRFQCDGPDQTDRHELYDLIFDPDETKDVAVDHPDVVADLGRLIDNFVRNTGAVLPVKNPDYSADAAKEPAGRVGQTFRLEGIIDGLDSPEIELRYELGSKLHREKVPITDGRFTAVLPVDRLTLVRGWLNVKRVVKYLADDTYVPSLSSELCFLAAPDAAVKVTGDVRGDFVNAFPAGDPINDALAALHRQLYPLMSRLAAIQRAEHLGDDTGAAAEDDPDLIKDRMQEIRLDFLQKHPDSPAAAWLLLDMLLREQVRPRKAAAILATLTCGPAGEPFLSSIGRKLAALERMRIGGAVGEFKTTRTLDRAAFDLQSLRGKHVVVDFWGSWCGPCCEEIPRLKEYAAKYPDTLRLVSIAVKTPPEAIAPFAMPWPQITNGQDDENYVESFAVEAFPTKLLLDTEGRIVARFVGGGDELFQMLDGLLGGPGAGGQPAAVVADVVHEQREAITADEARQLLQRLAKGGQLHLDAVETLPADVAAVLADHDGLLSLAALEELSAEAAAALANGKGTGSAARFFDGLNSTQEEAIVALLRQPYQHLSLGGLKKLSPAALEAIAQSSGSLALGGIRALSVDDARALARHSGGPLYLPSLKAIPDDALAALAVHQGGLGLDGLPILSAAAATALVGRDGYLSLRGLRGVDAELAATLARHHGFLVLDGVTNLPDTVALTLAKHKGGLNLMGLERLSPRALEALQASSGTLLPPSAEVEVAPQQ